VRFPSRWEKVATLVEGAAVVDPTVFFFEGRWWLLGADQETGSNNTLYAWHADDLFGPWVPHRANPLKTDVRSSRPAGTPFLHEGHLYRPAQDCSTTYGGSVVINRVTRLTPSEFHEEPVAVLRPDPKGPYPHGLHHISFAGGVTVVDGCVVTFVPEAFLQGARRAVRRAWTSARTAARRWAVPPARPARV
ncbi:MAG TPA: hypothetical protein VIN09_00545, partial [Chloroflexota bacterium]